MRRLATAVLLLACLPVRAAAGEFLWPGRGVIHLTAPASWKLASQPAEDVGYAFRAEPKAGPSVVVRLTLAHLPDGKTVRAEEMKDRLEKTVQPYLAGSVEKAFDPKPLTLAQGSGWVVQLTDASLVGRPSVPGDSKVMRNALVALDDQLMMVATIQFDDPARPEVGEAMAILASVRFERRSDGGFPPTAKEKSLRFKGDVVVDDALGISVAPDEKKKVIGVLSSRYRYMLLLPYAEDWEFFREGQALLRGNSGLVNLTVSAYETDEKPEAHLAEKRQLLETTPAGRGITKMETVSFKGQQVLRNEVDGGSYSSKFRGVTVVHYFVAKAAKGVLYELHLSVTVDPRRARRSTTRRGSSTSRSGSWSATGASPGADQRATRQVRAGRRSRSMAARRLNCIRPKAWASMPISSWDSMSSSTWSSPMLMRSAISVSWTIGLTSAVAVDQATRPTRTRVAASSRPTQTWALRKPANTSASSCSTTSVQPRRVLRDSPTSERPSGSSKAWSAAG